MVGSIVLLSAVLIVFIAANLSVGFTFSTFSKSQAMQMTFFFFLPSLLLSGFMFPFRSMPRWAQWLGEAFPLTHFLRIVRGIQPWQRRDRDFSNVWPIMLFLLIAGTIALNRYRETLD